MTHARPGPYKKGNEGTRAGRCALCAVAPVARLVCMGHLREASYFSRLRLSSCERDASAPRHWPQRARALRPRIIVVEHVEESCDGKGSTRESNHHRLEFAIVSLTH